MASNSDQHDWRDAVLERAAKAMWDTQRKQEIEKIEDFEFDDSIFIDAAKIVITANKGMSTIIGWALISKCIESGIKFHLKHGSKKDQKEFLEGFGPLATDSSRIRFALLMGWISNRDRGLLNCLRRSRNEIAHGIILDHNLNFPKQIEKTYRDELDAKINRMISAASEEDEQGLFDDGISDEAKSRMYFFLIANDILESVVCGPGRQRLGILESHKVFFDWDDSPEWARKNKRATSRAVLSIGAGKTL